MAPLSIDDPETPYKLDVIVYTSKAEYCLGVAYLETSGNSR